VSRLYEALKKAQQARAALAGSKASEPATQPPLAADRRRSARLALRVNILVYGRRVSGEPFYEETRTLQVSNNGCLLTLATPVTPGQRLVVISRNADREQQAQVVHQRAPKSQGAKVAVEFLEAAADFWPGALPADT